MEEDIIKNKTGGSYLSGTIGAIIGGLIGAIPWILVYIYANLIVSLLATLISLGALKGYQLFKGKISKSLSPIIIIITLAIVIFVNLIIVPNFIASNNDMELSYIYTQFKNELIHDLVLSLLFAILGIGFAMSYINKTLIKNEVVEDTEDILNKSEILKKAQIDMQLKSHDKKNLDMIRKIFDELNATSKKSAVEKETIIQKMDCEDLEKLFKKYKALDVIKKYKGKYYYQSKNEIFLTKSYWIWFIIFIAIITFARVYNSDNLNGNNNNEINYSANDIQYSNYTFCDNSLEITPSLDWIVDIEENYVENSEGIYIYSKDQNGVLSIFSISTSDLDDDFTLEQINNEEIEYSKQNYSLEEQPVTKDFTILGSKAYKNSFYTTLDGYKVNINFYTVKTDKHAIVAYAISTKSKSEQYLNDCEEMLDSLKEL